jgi:hypothetical protein
VASCSVLIVALASCGCRRAGHSIKQSIKPRMRKFDQAAIFVCWSPARMKLQRVHSTTFQSSNACLLQSGLSDKRANMLSVVALVALKLCCCYALPGHAAALLFAYVCACIYSPMVTASLCLSYCCKVCSASCDTERRACTEHMQTHCTSVATLLVCSRQR